MINSKICCKSIDKYNVMRYNKRVVNMIDWGGSMECPYCGKELIHHDSYGTGHPSSFYGTAGNGIYYPSNYQKCGDIYKCSNSEGFESEDEAMSYTTMWLGEDNLEEYLKKNGYTSWEEVVCESDTFNGNFYTVEGSETLHEGYPV